MCLAEKIRTKTPLKRPRRDYSIAPANANSDLPADVRLQRATKWKHSSGLMRGIAIMRILAATDGSESATRAVELAARLTKELDGRLKIIHIVSEEDVPEDQLSDYAHSEHSTSAEVLNVFSEDKLKVVRQRAEALGGSGVEAA